MKKHAEILAIVRNKLYLCIRVMFVSHSAECSNNAGAEGNAAENNGNGGRNMILTLANPIYDSVFKFLMEDERVARTVLTALLKKEVVSVEMRRHEHPNVTRNEISMFRIDFAAHVREEDGSVKLILIELQKTWLDTETLRFRQYLAAQYNAEENIVKEEGKRSHALPMVAVYLLGHRVGSVEEPVVYVNHVARNYDGEEVKEGMNDPFIGSLVHDSIIVQLPLLRGKINNRLYRVLSVFDQQNRDRGDRHYVKLDERNYEGDQDMMYLLHRLTQATVDAELREEMKEEDLYFSEIEERDTLIMQANKNLAEKDSQLKEKDSQLAEKDNQLAAKDDQLAVKEAQLLSMAKAMQQSGMRLETIATAMQLPLEEVTKLLEM